MATYVDGYIEDRVNRGHVRGYCYPPDVGLPKFRDESFPDLKPSFVEALRLREAVNLQRTS